MIQISSVPSNRVDLNCIRTLPARRFARAGGRGNWEASDLELERSEALYWRKLPSKPISCARKIEVVQPVS